MTVKRSEYSLEYVMNYKKQVDKEMLPIIQGWNAVSRNTLIRFIFWLFALCSGAYAVTTIVRTPWRADKWALYVVLLVIAGVYMIQSSAEDHTNAMVLQYSKCFLTVTKIEAGLDQIVNAYTDLEELQDIIEKAAETNPEEVRSMFKEAGKDIPSNGIIDFTGVDEEFKDFMKNVDDFKSKCRQCGVSLG